MLQIRQRVRVFYKLQTSFMRLKLLVVKLVAVFSQEGRI